jgi:ribosomal protein S18 acetylase RimI-like enzyme
MLDTPTPRAHIVSARSAVSGEDWTFLVQNAQGFGETAGHYLTWPQSIQLGGRLSQRPANPADNDFLLAVFAESRPDLALLPEAVRAQVIRMQFDLQLRQYRTSAPDAVDRILEFEHDGRTEPVGRCYLQRGTSEHRLLDIAIRPDRRGRGLGSAALRRLCLDAARDGVPLRLNVWQANEGAIRLYRRLGFVEEGADGGYLGMRWTGPKPGSDTEDEAIGGINDE